MLLFFIFAILVLNAFSVFFLFPFFFFANVQNGFDLRGLRVLRGFNKFLLSITGRGPNLGTTPGALEHWPCESGDPRKCF